MNQEQIEGLHDRIEQAIKQMHKIQRNIRASRQPAAQYEIESLKQLGREYAEIVSQLEQAAVAGSSADKPGD